MIKASNLNIPNLVGTNLFIKSYKGSIIEARNAGLYLNQNKESHDKIISKNMRYNIISVKKTNANQILIIFLFIC